MITKALANRRDDALHGSSAASWISYITRCYVSTVLTMSAISQLRMPFSVVSEVNSMAFIPSIAVGLISALMPVLYLAVSVAIVGNWFTGMTNCLALILFACFTVIHVLRWITAVDLSCGCFDGVYDGKLNPYSHWLAFIGLGLLTLNNALRSVRIGEGIGN